jgi:pimeloyl-ACP methyl ester carboxylesterase
MIYLFPGMGADRRMYPGSWSNLKPRTCIEWPAYAGETSIHALAKRIIADHRIVPDDLLVGASLGGIVACEIAKTTPVAGLVLVGSAKSKEEINRFVSMIHPLIDLTPLRFAQRLSASAPGELAQMFSDSQAAFIRAMCRAIFDWDGLGDVSVDLLRIHGRQDKVIPLPKGIQHVLNGGHLIAMTHAQECVDIIVAHHRTWSGL